MRRGSRVWWLYYSVQMATVVALTGIVSLVVSVLLKRLWLLDNDSAARWAWLSFGIMQTVARSPAEKAALAACRAAGLSRDSYVAHWLERVEPSEPPAPDPPPIDRSGQSAGARRVLAWMSALLGAVSAMLAVVSWFQRDWAGFTVGIVGALLCPLMGVLAWRLRCVLEVDERGLRHRLHESVVPWASIERGWVSKRHGVDGALCDEWLCLQDARGKRVWFSRIENLPPEVRADLFAWLRARANLRDPSADAERGT